ncbi:hypothetical protein J3R30DRAFT_3553522 [Lentinula aciculospora]|uniref:Uncharacterized protein n=1 Tax=Lentinula aciculospora TaxID=153920 RepID=A0A9W8ZX90_9AGAR|nr:hypothetical protein J3R30DRAFT_3553522 [Lentinula aciculospora]
MVAITRAQAKRIAAAAAATSSSIASPATIAANNRNPTKPFSARKHAVIRAKQSGAQSSVPNQSPAKRSRIANKRKPPRRPTTPVLTDGESSMESTEQPKIPAENHSIPTETQPSSLTSFVNPDDDKLIGSKTGWVRFGNSYRRELVLPDGVISQIQAQQQVDLALRGDEAYKEQTKEMMQQHNLTYQWYDRMMTEGLQNGQGSSDPLVLGSSDSVMKDDFLLERSGFNEDTDMANDEAKGSWGARSEAEEFRNSSSNESMSSTGSNSSSMVLFETDESIPPSQRKQLQPCPPGVQYSLFSTPTEIISPF